MLRWFALIGCLLASGCAMLPEIVHQPTLHNPFPQISKVAVATFFNPSSEPTLDGRKVAEAYAAELAEVPGYVVIPVSQVETAMRAYGLQLEKEKDARRLAQILQVDAVVVGVVTEYTPYYPPRMTLQVRGSRPIRTSIPFRPAMACRGERRARKTFLVRWSSRPSWHWRKSNSRRKLRLIRNCPLNPPTSDGPGGASVPNSPPGVPGQPLKGAAAGGKQTFARSRMRRRIRPHRQTRQPAPAAATGAGDLNAWRKWSGASAELARPARIHSPAAHRAARRPACPATSR